MPVTPKNKTPNGVHGKLLEALGKVDRPGDVCTGGDLPLTMPGLTVEGLGSVGLPLTKSQACELIKLCQQAPYGKGTETLVDTNVRRVWELDPTRFQLTNPKWDSFVTSIVADVQKNLGLDDRKLTAQLYKLLVYEAGSFFLPHRDGEKLDRMVATLVIGLPSEYEGGELVVSHDGQQHEFAFTGAASGYELSYAAFYADCQHEVRPLHSGYRLCLTYNVTLAKTQGKQGIVAPSYGSTSAVIGKLLTDWSTDEQKLAVTLEHRYTQDGLTLDKLKGIDRAQTEVLFAAAEQAGCVAHLALVTLWQSGSAEGDYQDYSYGRGRGYRRSDDEDDMDYNETAGEHEMGEIYDWSLSADHWSDREGKKVLLGEIRLSENEIVAPVAMDEVKPSREDFEGFTGNAGMTLERWYHRAAVVIWPREKHFHVLCEAGTDAAVGGLAPMVERLKRAGKPKREEQRQECLAFATAIIDSWLPARAAYRSDKMGVDRSTFPASLCELNDPDLVRRFLSEVLPRDGAVQLDKSFGKFFKEHGWENFETELTTVLQSATGVTIGRNAELLQILCTLRDKSPQRIGVCTRLSTCMAGAVETFDQNPGERSWRVSEVDRAALLGSLAAAMLAVDAEKPLDRLIEHTLSCDKYDLTGAHLAAIFALEKRLTKLPAKSTAVARWLSKCRDQLKARTAAAPQKPTDQRRTAELSCNCRDCKALAVFLADPDQSQARFPLAKARRQHLHQIINSNHCDCTHVTEHIGSPHTLVCTKTTALYDEASKIHERDLENLTRIIAIEKKIG